MITEQARNEQRTRMAEHREQIRIREEQRKQEAIARLPAVHAALVAGYNEAMAAQDRIKAHKAAYDAKIKAEISRKMAAGGSFTLDVMVGEGSREIDADAKITSAYVSNLDTYRSWIKSDYHKAHADLDKAVDAKEMRAGYQVPTNLVIDAINAVFGLPKMIQMEHTTIVATLEAATAEIRRIIAEYKEDPEITAKRLRKQDLVKEINDAVRHHKQALVRLQKDPESKAAQKKYDAAKATYERAKAEYDAL